MNTRWQGLNRARYPSYAGAVDFVLFTTFGNALGTHLPQFCLREISSCIFEENNAAEGFARARGHLRRSSIALDARHLGASKGQQ